MDDPGKAVACEGTEDEGATRLAAAAEPLGGTGAVGHLSARLAGRARREAVPDRHDRRCDEPVVRAVRAARFDRGKHEIAVGLPGEVRKAAGILYGQGQYLWDGGEAQTGRAGSRQRPRGDAADADRTRLAGVGNRVDRGAQPAGERTRGEEFRDSTGSFGEGPACSRSEDP